MKENMHAQRRKECKGSEKKDLKLIFCVSHCALGIFGTMINAQKSLAPISDRNLHHLHLVVIRMEKRHALQLQNILAYCERMRTQYFPEN